MLNNLSLYDRSYYFLWEPSQLDAYSLATYHSLLDI
ncbi:unnamed protein product [Acanthoscelides obtectus]|uniref:Uncharacterized protein n=1 Tax=Acanthoscelides obtectus TaxID=200917 RepID=A0A9P0MIP8_ACAOB|nr:unnamed protein product [Acanthoscelides obtectus]CAK1667994.1 hypothetical protein AOBTE_LOCUS26168 [Acanthoscelides obtectus]